MTMTALPDWMRPPRPEGWLAEDLDHLPDAPRHTELVDGALVFMMSPQRWWHGHLLTRLAATLMDQAPSGFAIGREMSIRLDERNRPEPDLLVTTAAYKPDQTWFAPEDVRLVVEVVSPESEHRDRNVKLRKYAEAGIAHYWLIEDEGGSPAVHVYELDGPTRIYAPVGIVRDTLQVTAPFPIEITLGDLLPG
jgi:Uma2 family endonuclease